ncbi:penicillin-binding protein 2 [candidate division KSB1 bacterium 4572_119]|nr:MAG: penicillin-binding protein 2 [candidate division KSB1 bacterium 4572_119]
MLADQQIKNKKKQYQYSIFLGILFFILIAQLFYLQVYKQAIYLKASENNRIRQVILKSTRGLILDRNGEVLVDNHPSYSVYATPFEVQDADTVLRLISRILNIESEEISKIIKEKQAGYFTPVRLKRHIDFSTLSKIEEYKLDLPGISIQNDPKRYYPSGVRAPHLFGYLGELTREEYESRKKQGIKFGEIVGKKGLEMIYDTELRGVNGYRYVEVDVLGREIKRLSDKRELLDVPGQNLHLTIDAGLQKFLESRMDTIRGGAIAVDCETGGILALVSKPDYDPDIFSKPLSEDIWNSLLSDQNKPLYDRMVQSLYPPGSTFKLVLAAAALEKGIITPERTETCVGFYRLGTKTYDCWKKEGHGELDLLGAIEQSCNVYFYTLGLKTGQDIWAEYSKKFLFDKPTGIDLMAENSGLVPDREYLDKKYGKNKWSRGLIANQAIGQGDLLVTPLQMLRFTMILANDGFYHKPHVVNFREDVISNKKEWTEIETKKIPDISEKTYKILKEGMRRVVQGERGTAKGARCSGLEVAGKTGTAENPHGEPHAWFLGFAPFDKPKIALCILIENGGSGGAVAAPLGGDVIRYFFNSIN